MEKFLGELGGGGSGKEVPGRVYKLPSAICATLSSDSRAAAVVDVSTQWACVVDVVPMYQFACFPPVSCCFFYAETGFWKQPLRRPVPKLIVMYRRSDLLRVECDVEPDCTSSRIEMRLATTAPPQHPHRTDLGTEKNYFRGCYLSLGCWHVRKPGDRIVTVGADLDGVKVTLLPDSCACRVRDRDRLIC